MLVQTGQQALDEPPDGVYSMAFHHPDSLGPDDGNIGLALKIHQIRLVLDAESHGDRHGCGFSATGQIGCQVFGKLRVCTGYPFPGQAVDEPGREGLDFCHPFIIGQR